jgi:hypothetical protein
MQGHEVTLADYKPASNPPGSCYGLTYYPSVCLKELREVIEILCLDSQYPSHAIGDTAQVNLPSTKTDVNGVSRSQKNGQT